MGCLPAARELGGGFAAGGGRGAGIRLWEAETGVARFVVGTGDTARVTGTGGAGAGAGITGGAVACIYPASLTLLPLLFFFFFLVDALSTVILLLSSLSSFLLLSELLSKMMLQVETLFTILLIFNSSSRNFSYCLSRVS